MSEKATDDSCMAITLWWSWPVSPMRTAFVCAAAADCFAATPPTSPSSIAPKESVGADVGKVEPRALAPETSDGATGGSSRVSGETDRGFMVPMGFMLLLSDLQGLLGHHP